MPRVPNVVRNAFRAAAPPVVSLLVLAACGSDQPTEVQAPPVNAAVATVEVGALAGPLVVGRTATLSVTPRDAQGRQLSGRTVTWTSSATDIARVDANGVVTAVAPGSATLTAAVETKSASVLVTVSAVPVATVAITTPATTLRAGETLNLTAVARDADGAALPGRTITWQSGTPAVATVNATTGAVTAVGVGAVVITATSEGKSSTLGLTVIAAATPVARVVVAASPDTLEAFDQARCRRRSSTRATTRSRDARWSGAAPTPRWRPSIRRRACSRVSIAAPSSSRPPARARPAVRRSWS